MRLPRVEDFEVRSRGEHVTSRVGLVLGIAFAVCFLTGIWSHLQYDPPRWAPIGPAPASLYRLTQGVHVVTGLACIPLVLVKLFSVFPRLFVRPPRPVGERLVHGIERGSILVLVGSSLFLLVSGALNVVQWYPWSFSFRATHHAMAWVAIGSVLVHVAVKLPVIARGLAPIEEDEEPVGDGPGRRDVLRVGVLASLATGVLTAGQAVPWLRGVSLFAIRDGSGQQGLPVNRTAEAAGATEAAQDPGFRLVVRGEGREVELSRDDLLALPQRTHRLPIACVEGWSREAEWTGVAVRDLLSLVGARFDADVAVGSLQTRGAFASSELPGRFVADTRTILALQLNGEDLSLDHGYPCRIIAPNRPGVLQTKWVEVLEVRA